jgi:hypothetical protein
MFSDSKGGTLTEGVWEQGVEEKDYKVDEDEVGGTCGTNGREEERV